MSRNKCWHDGPEYCSDALAGRECQAKPGPNTYTLLMTFTANTPEQAQNLRDAALNLNYESGIHLLRHRLTRETAL